MSDSLELAPSLRNEHQSSITNQPSNSCFPRASEGSLEALQAAIVILKDSNITNVARKIKGCKLSLDHSHSIKRLDSPDTTGVRARNLLRSTTENSSLYMSPYACLTTSISARIEDNYISPYAEPPRIAEEKHLHTFVSSGRNLVPAEGGFDPCDKADYHWSNLAPTLRLPALNRISSNDRSSELAIELTATDSDGDSDKKQTSGVSNASSKQMAQKNKYSLDPDVDAVMRHVIDDLMHDQSENSILQR